MTTVKTLISDQRKPVLTIARVVRVDSALARLVSDSYFGMQLPMPSQISAPGSQRNLHSPPEQDSQAL